MKQLRKDLAKICKQTLKTNRERAKLLVMFIITLGALAGGLYGCFMALSNAGVQILIFLLCSVWVWFGVGMLDLFRDMYKK
tara:strand:- start:213 stop:455 length:243 start_codon:yes stop_codon:yes gene_type:complete